MKQTPTLVHSLILKSLLFLFLATAGLLLVLSHPYSGMAAAPHTAADLSVYTDGLASGWSDWSWDTTVNLAAAFPVHTGNASVSTQFNNA